MNLEIVPAIVAGLLGGLAMTAAHRAAGALGARLRMDVLRLWGAFVAARGPDDRAFGWIIHLAVSAAIGIAYGLGFQILGASDQLWLWGLAGAVIHAAIAGLVISLSPPLYREEPSLRAGVFASGFGWTDTVGFVAGHMAYGVTVGIAYALLHSSGGVARAF